MSLLFPPASSASQASKSQQQQTHSTLYHHLHPPRAVDHHQQRTAATTTTCYIDPYTGDTVEVISEMPCEMGMNSTPLPLLNRATMSSDDVVDPNTPSSEAYNLSPPPGTPAAACSLLTSAPSSCPSAYERTASSTSSVRSGRGNLPLPLNQGSPSLYSAPPRSGGLLLLSPTSRSAAAMGCESHNTSHGSGNTTPHFRIRGDSNASNMSLGERGGKEQAGGDSSPAITRVVSDKQQQQQALLLQMAPPPATSPPAPALMNGSNRQSLLSPASISDPRSINNNNNSGVSNKHSRGGLLLVQNTSNNTSHTNNNNNNNNSNNHNGHGQSQSYNSYSSSAPSSHRSSTPSSYRPGDEDNLDGGGVLPPISVISLTKKLLATGGGRSPPPPIAIIVESMPTASSGAPPLLFTPSSTSSSSSSSAVSRSEAAATTASSGLAPAEGAPTSSPSLLLSPPSASIPSKSGVSKSALGDGTPNVSPSDLKPQLLLQVATTGKEDVASPSSASQDKAVEQAPPAIGVENETQQSEETLASPPPSSASFLNENEHTKRTVEAAPRRHMTPMGTPITANLSFQELFRHRQFIHHQKTQVMAYEHELLHKFILNHSNKVQSVSRGDHKAMLKILISEAYRNDPHRRENKARWERIMRDAMREVDSKNSVLLSVAPDPYHGVLAKLSSMLLHNSSQRAQYWSYRYWEEEMLRRRSVQQATLSQLREGRLFLDSPVVPGKQKFTGY